MLNHIIFQTSKWSLYCGVECASLNSGCSPHKQNERWYRLIVPSLDSLFRLFFKPKRLALNLRRLCTIYIHFQSFQEMVLPFLNIYIATAGFFGVVRYGLICFGMRVFVLSFLYMRCALRTMHASVYNSSDLSGEHMCSSKIQRFYLNNMSYHSSFSFSFSSSLSHSHLEYKFLMLFSDFH